MKRDFDRFFVWIIVGILGILIIWGAYNFLGDYKTGNTIDDGIEGQLGEGTIFCNYEAKLCDDGSIVRRNFFNSCQFNECPELVECFKDSSCDKGNCYLFENEKKTYCYQGNPCLKCPSGNCDLTQTDPIKIVCN